MCLAIDLADGSYRLRKITRRWLLFVIDSCEVGLLFHACLAAGSLLLLVLLQPRIIQIELPLQVRTSPCLLSGACLRKAVVCISLNEAAIVTFLTVSDISDRQGLHEVLLPSGPCVRLCKSYVGKLTVRAG